MGRFGHARANSARMAVLALRRSSATSDGIGGKADRNATSGPSPSPNPMPVSHVASRVLRLDPGVGLGRLNTT